jgi:calpain-15
VEVELRRGSILTCATSPYVAQLGKNDQDRMGIYSNHAYSLLNVYSALRDREGREVTLLRVRNPWGKKEWQGRWGFKSELWTAELRKQVDYEVDPKDGSFFMSREDFITHFEHVNICRVNLSFCNSWVELEADREEFKAVRLTVREKGDYYFTLYQENPRRYAGRPYEKSKSWMFLLEQKGDKLVAVGSSCKDKRDNTL